MTDKLILYYSTGIPELPARCREEKTLSLKRLSIEPKRKQNSLERAAFFLDHSFIEKNNFRLSEIIQKDQSVLIWNPEAKPLPEGFPEKLVYDEVYGFNNPESFLRTLRNLYKAMHLERELEIKNALIMAKDKVYRELLDIGIALSAERDNEKLLDQILYRTREITRSDAGSLYLLLKKEETVDKYLLFKIAHNDSNPTDFTEFSMPLNVSSLAGYVAVNGVPLNIPDAYDIPEETGITFNKSYDESTGYRTKSILTVPMKDHKGEILGVIQLINKKREFIKKLKTPEDVESYVEPFNSENESLVLSLASMAAVSLENNNLYNEIETLFEGFVRASVKAIESRDPTTSGHSSRVALYTVGLAETVDRLNFGPYADVAFTREQIKEIRYASLLHDFGKVGVREHVLVKAKKLYPEQLKLIEQRFAFIRKTLHYDFLQKRYQLLLSGGKRALEEQETRLTEEERGALLNLEEYLSAVLEANEPKILEGSPAKILEEITRQVYQDSTGKTLPLLFPEEGRMLRIRRGSLNEEERTEIESHVIHTFEFLKNIPWTSQLKEIPTIARWHHEKLNGEGYPDKVRGEDIPLQTKMMTVSDIYDALTAMDRPYKKAVPPAAALDILQKEVESNHLDKTLVDLFIQSKIYTRTDT